MLSAVSRAKPKEPTLEGVDEPKFEFSSPAYYLCDFGHIASLRLFESGFSPM